MNPFTIFIRRCIYISLGLFDKLQKRQTNIVIFCYHSIGASGWRFSISEKEFIRQIKHISKTHEPVALDQIVKHLEGTKKLTKPSFVVTFDDGYQDNLTVVEFCKKMQIIPTIFVLSDPARANRKSLANTLPLLTQEQIMMLVDLGVDIGLHTATHQVLPLKSSAFFEREIVWAKKTLEKNIRTKISFFAYPKGEYSDRVITYVKNAGFVGAVSMDDAQVDKTTNIYTLPRVGVDGTHNRFEFPFIYSPSVIAFRRMVKRSPLKKFI